MPSHLRQVWCGYLKLPVLALLAIIVLLLGLILLTVAFARVGNVDPSYFGRTAGEPARIIVLVHGTFAPNADWTEPQSTLVKAIRAAEPANDILFVCFGWPGSIDGYQNNTNFVRYGAGQELTDLLWRLRRQYLRPFHTWSVLDLLMPSPASRRRPPRALRRPDRPRPTAHANSGATPSPNQRACDIRSTTWTLNPFMMSSRGFLSIAEEPDSLFDLHSKEAAADDDCVQTRGY